MYLPQSVELHAAFVAENVPHESNDHHPAHKRHQINSKGHNG